MLACILDVEGKMDFMEETFRRILGGEIEFIFLEKRRLFRLELLDVGLPFVNRPFLRIGLICRNLGSQLSSIVFRHDTFLKSTHNSAISGSPFMNHYFTRNLPRRETREVCYPG